MATDGPTGATPFGPLLRAESRSAPGIRHLAATIGLALMGALLAWWLPTFPESVYRFFNRAFALEGWAEIVVANNFTGLFFFTYWVGAFDLLSVAVVPREERHLDLFLAKPVTPRAYLAAKLIPILVLALGTGAIAAAAHWLAMAAAGLDYGLPAYAGAAAILLAWCACLLALVNALILRSRDIYSALVIAFIPAFASMFPGMVCMYRPDVFATAPGIRGAIVFPMNLIWSPGFCARWGFPVAALLLAAAIALIARAGRRLGREDVA